jgi:transposase
LRAGKSIRDVAFALDASVSSVERWKQAYRAKGAGAFQLKVPSGRPSKLGANQLRELETILLQGAMASGYPEEQWTLQRIGRVIEKRFGVRLDPSWVRRILIEKLKWTHQKPEQLALERHEKEIGRWVAKDWARIKKSEKVSGTPNFLG